MHPSEIPDPHFRDAVSAIDAGNLRELSRLLSAYPRLIRERAECGAGYFHRPYLLWFVAENPVRNCKLPRNIVQVTRAILNAAQHEEVDTLRAQVDHALTLVASGRVAREFGVQRALIDVLIDAGANPNVALVPAFAHREQDATQHLVERGAELTLPAAICMRRPEDWMRLAPAASAEDRQLALAAAALYGQADALSMLIPLGVQLNAFSPPGFHPHATAMHHAVDSGSLDAVKVLVAAGADLAVKDRVHKGTPLDWAEHLHRGEIAAYLRQASP